MDKVLGVAASPPLAGLRPQPAARSSRSSIANAQRERLPQSGDVFEVRYPFVRDEFEHFDEEGPCKVMSWRPGVRSGVDQYRDWTCADAEGLMRLTVVSVHKPGRFPPRVFYTRQFVSPDGKTFGKGGCQIATLDKFRRIVRGYRYTYDLGEPRKDAPSRVAASEAAFLAELLRHASEDVL